MQPDKILARVAVTLGLALGLGAAHALPLPAPLAAHPLLVRDGLAPPDPMVADSLPRYLQSRSARFVAWLADGSLLISTRFGDTEQIHRVRTPLGMREQLTFAPGGVIAAAAKPASSDTLAFLTAHTGGGTQLFLQPLDRSGGARALTDGSYQDGPPVWAPDGNHLAFVSNRRNSDDADVYVLDTRVPGIAPRLVAAANGFRWRIDGWSSDDRHLLLAREQPAGEPAPLYIADVQDGAVTAVTAPAAHARSSRRRRRQPAGPSATGAALSATAARFASDGSGLLLLTRAAGPGTASGAEGRDTGYLHLVYFDPQDGRWQNLSAPSAHDVQLFDESPDGRYVAYTLDENGASQLMLNNQPLRLVQPVSAVPAGVISSLAFDASGRHLALTLESSRSPPDVYVFDTALATLTRWTHSEVGPVDSAAFVQPEALHFPTWDRPDGQNRQLLALVYNPGPETLGAGAPRPVVIWLCSGGGTQCRPRFAPFVQYLVAQLGCVVIAPDVRGSSGLGTSLLTAGQGVLRDDTVRDVGALLAWIGVQPGLDRGRVALLGEGFGSYLALQSLTEYGDRLQGAVAAFPPALAGLGNVQAIRRPVLLVQGLDNRAVPAYQAAQLREGLRAQGVPVEYLAASDEAAQFSRRSTRDAYRIAAASFLARLLR